MDISGAKLKPAEGMVAVEFIDDDTDSDPATPEEPVAYCGLLAVVVGVGAKVTGTKVGDIAVMSPYARDGLCIGGRTFLCSAYEIKATVAA